MSIILGICFSLNGWLEYESGDIQLQLYSQDRPLDDYPYSALKWSIALLSISIFLTVVNAGINSYLMLNIGRSKKDANAVE